LGHDAEQRYEQCVAVWESLALDRPQVHVNMIGVRDAYRGRGLARIMLNEAHALCGSSPNAEGVSLTTENPRNVDFYRYLGYEVIGQADIAEGLTTWSFFRPR
jgi:ribosomal protein S18 acetylase RimI-like enzyme